MNTYPLRIHYCQNLDIYIVLLYSADYLSLDLVNNNEEYNYVEKNRWRNIMMNDNSNIFPDITSAFQYIEEQDILS